MALYHYTEKTESELVKKLTEKLGEQKSVFTPQWIASGHNSTNNYLIDTIANQNGIAANIKFKQVIPLIEMIHTSLGLVPDKRELIRNEQLIWFIDDVLKSEGFNQLPEAEKVKDFIEEKPLKSFTLAEKINGLFSSYQEEKPMLTAKWNNAETLTENPDEIWQAFIWQKLKNNFGDHIRDLSTIFNEIKEALQKKASKSELKKLFPTLFFFGNLPYTKQLVDLLEVLAETIDIFVFRRIFPAKNDNPIINNLGSFIQRDEKLWEKITAEQSSESESLCPKKNLLGALQQNLVENTKDKIDYNASDDSLVIASSYTVSREVEALYHHLIYLFKTNEDLAAKDVCVVIPDMESYASAIKTYFDYSNKIDHAGNPKQLIPYTIYDTSRRVYASPYSAIEALLSLELDGFTSKNVLKLLDFDFIRERFGFKDTELLYRALDKANIRHGLSGDIELETDLVSWRYGLKRLIYGSCLPPDSQNEIINFEETEFFPVVDFEESSRFELFKLSEFIETLYNWLETRSQIRSLNQWVEFLEEETLNVFISQEVYDTSKFRRLLGQLHQVFDHGINNTYNFEVIRYYTAGALVNISDGESLGFGGVRFVFPSMFLSVPAKVYAFLGLNGADFPRKVTRVSFDLSDKDRLTKTDYDKNLFLNILLAAEEKLYLSYIGSNTKDNSETPPSSLISELESHLIQFLNQDVDTLTIRHPLHSFSSRYNQKEHPLLVHYHMSKVESSDEIMKESQYEYNSDDSRENVKKVIQLNDLTNFMEDPTKHYFTKTLGIYISDRSIELEETELFSLDALQSWKVKDELVISDLNDGIVDEKALKMRGLLPLSNIGKKTLEDLQKGIQPILENEKLKELIKLGPKAIKPIKLELDDFIIEGKLNSMYDDTLLFVTPSKNKAKHQIRSLMNYYVAFCQGAVANLLYVTIDGKSKQVSYGRQDEEKIRQILSSWCKKYEDGKKDLIYFDSCFIEKPKLSSLMIDRAVLNVNKLNGIILYGTILNSFESSIFPSEYFKHIAQNDGFLSIKKANSFFDMYNDIKEFTKPLNK